uniref:Uncharacterized protein n=1 Tax=viral metagenome TaxID=1070528 RepID=A0A6M3IVJ9_9ZZZZ
MIYIDENIKADPQIKLTDSIDGLLGFWEPIRYGGFKQKNFISGEIQTDGFLKYLWDQRYFYADKNRRKFWSFSQTYAGTNRTRINSAGLLETVATNVPVIDHTGTSLTPALRLEPAGTNLLFGDNDFDAAHGWTLEAGTTSVKDSVGPDGTANSATTVSDISVVVVALLRREFFKSASDSTTKFQDSLSFKKTTASASFPIFAVFFTGVADRYGGYCFNTDTGTVTLWDLNSAANIGYAVKDEGEFWRLTVWATDNGANTTVAFRLFPAANTDGGATRYAATVGSCVIANGMLTTGSIPSSYFAGAASQGAEQASGTLTIGKSYIITATEVDHFFAGCAVSNYFIAAAETALDANNKVKEHGTVRLSESNTTTLAIPAAVAAALADTGTIVIKGRFTFARAAGVVTGILTSDTTNKLIYTTTAAGNISSDDGTTVAENTGAYTANTDWKIALKWPSDTNKYRIGIDVDGAGIVWGTEVAFDGSFATGANLILGHILHGPTWIKWVKMYDSILTDAQINSM